MKKIFVLCLLLMLATLCLSPRSEAMLVFRGVDNNGVNLIYDEDRDITWYDFPAPTRTWQQQMDWALGLSVSYEGRIIDGWRLPSALNEDGTDPSPLPPHDETRSEMGHLFYEDDHLNLDHPNGNTNVSWMFISLVTAAIYWSETPDVNSSRNVWAFSFNSGNQISNSEGMSRRGLAVRSGDIAAVPEPTLGLLLGISLVGLVGVGVARKIKQGKVTNA